MLSLAGNTAESPAKRQTAPVKIIVIKLPERILRMIFFHTWVWSNVIVAIIGFLGTAMLAISALLIPWGLRLPKKARHPFNKSPAVNNACNQSTTSRQEWWGANFNIFGWILLSISFFMQILVVWPVGQSLKSQVQYLCQNVLVVQTKLLGFTLFSWH